MVREWEAACERGARGCAGDGPAARVLLRVPRGEGVLGADSRE